VASLAAHAALVLGCLVWGIDHDAARGAVQAVIEFHPVPRAEEAAPAPTKQFEVAAVAASPAAVPRRDPVVRRRRAIAAPAPVPVSTEDDSFQAVPYGDPDGDDEAPDSVSVAAEAGPSTGGGVSSESASAKPAPSESAVSPLEAAYLRLYQTYPNLPRSLWVHGRIYTVAVQMCITAEGRVDEVTLKQGAAPELDALVLSTLRTWRYRSRIVQGKPRAFCHPMIIHYDVE
jgi:protein TonB